MNHTALFSISLGIVILIIVFLLYMIPMPGKGYHGPLAELSPAEQTLKKSLLKDIKQLSETIGARNITVPNQLEKAVHYLKQRLQCMGYTVNVQPFQVQGLTLKNIEAELKGTKNPEEIIIVGAHYDSVAHDNCPAANDNASGVAAVLSLASAFVNKPLEKTVRFVLFTNEEPPFFQSVHMGSRRYAMRSKENKENIVAMVSLETIGYYSTQHGSQQYPFPLSVFYPSTGDFIGFVGNLSSRHLVRQAIKLFRENRQFPSEGGAFMGWLPGIGWSDHWAFWEAGYPAMMVTDTALYRYPYYHSREDTFDKLDYDRLARVVLGLELVIQGLANN